MRLKYKFIDNRLDGIGISTLLKSSNDQNLMTKKKKNDKSIEHERNDNYLSNRNDD